MSMKTRYAIQQILVILLGCIIASCDSGGGQQVAGIGGTGYTASGPITGFGSIFVNGIEFETDDALVTVDGVEVSDAALRLGMVVTVVGTLQSDGVTGTADKVKFNDDVQGPISAITVSADGTEKILLILGVSVKVDQFSTVFDDVSFETLAINDLVEVSGLAGVDSIIDATRVEKKENFIEGVSEVEFKGVISGLTVTSFNLGSLSVDFSAADLSGVAGGTLSNGLSVEVKGTLSGSVISAIKIEEEDGIFEDDQEGASIEGLITDFVSKSNFKISGQLVNAGNAVVNPADLQLQNGLQVQVKGEVVSGVLIASEVESRNSEIKLMASVYSNNVSNGTGTIVLAYAAGNVSFAIDKQTELGDETDTFDPFRGADIRAGDFLEVKALKNGQQLVATELKLRQPTDELLEGPVEGFVANSEITLLGVNYLTAGAIFKDSGDFTTSESTFYSRLDSGDLVKIRDVRPADGVADQIELED